MAQTSAVGDLAATVGAGAAVLGALLGAVVTHLVERQQRLGGGGDDRQRADRAAAAYLEVLLAGRSRLRDVDEVRADNKPTRISP